MFNIKQIPIKAVVRFGKPYMKVCHKCDSHFQHHHKLKSMALLCSLIQDIINADKLEFWWLRHFNKEKYNKIKLAMKGSNRRALERRLKKGKPII